MALASSLTFKIAATPEEIEQIHRLNYQTFVEEIPQHAANSQQKLQDRFHDENTYIIGQHDGQLVGMLAVRHNRPFSLDDKLPELDAYLPPQRALCEIRLLAVAPAYRHGVIFRGLLAHLVDYCKAQRYDLAVISGTLRQQKLYSHLGFIRFGPMVGTPSALYQPMYITLAAFEQRGLIHPRMTKKEGYCGGETCQLTTGADPN